MISPRMAKFIEILPQGLLKVIAKKVLYGYIKKYANITVKGMENINGIKRPVIFICNHLSNADALILNKVLINEDLTFVAGVKLSQNPVTNLGISIVKTIPIKPNSADKDAISRTIKLIKKGNSILIFPEGTRSRTAKMIEAKKGVLLIVKLSNALIVPVGLCGTEKLLPISDADMGGEKFKYADVCVNIGEPIELPNINENEQRHEYESRALGFIMKKIAVLLPESYRGFYGE